MKHASLFSGIGGFDLAASYAGFTNIFQVEIDPFCQQVLDKNFRNTQKHTDIFTFDGKKYANQIDILSGGFPCQPFSSAGHRKGTDDERYLWEEMLRVVAEVQPPWVVAENVGGIATIDNGLVFEHVCIDRESEGYTVQPFCIPACAKNYEHRRDRWWFVAYSDSAKRKRQGSEPH
jgi:DNA (cytosine-5)-methyltransferase 1